jgi:hypothetical protein
VSSTKERLRLKAELERVRTTCAVRMLSDRVEGRPEPDPWDSTAFDVASELLRVID